MTRRADAACNLMDMDTQSGPPNLLPIAEAARRAGRTTKTMRRWIAAGRVTSYRDPVSGWLYLDANEVSTVATPIRETQRRVSA